ncbi:glycoside hydrolase family 2 TIM barrel-domain containing protein [Saccharolobus solfataricus]|uniref:Beta-glucuronidase n=3 Tax=Saccharolobus solfataricus TaxID=2287 RepID=Q97UI1_SACS2|nr:glycoside hydrolase family 2 TIM barrel-domain containing protein [Saccharolobus solfataricus]AET42956.1 beta-glucuronidase-like protein [Saccharolobus solfataricus 98/2]AAK43138.1 Beta-glucuronidase (gusB) [Saccharolobus solfataricus P2]AKA73181.1 glycoside hydrolase family 2 protein [Saccharolobus solfataricus]AKA75879.1 glycoside hydrolase family 2 protein [Saccharolobus solfataricus]AKA78571.1 glycoside hydrolase family 2 protein [Saccharolobus solfataricus]
MRSFYRPKIDLQGFWKFKIDNENTGEENGWYKGLESEDIIYVPASWNEQNPKWDQFSGIAWYQKDLFVSNDNGNRKAWMVFEGAGYITKLWINGEYGGTHEGSFTQFKFPIKLKVNEFNKIVVKIDNTPSPYNLPPARDLNNAAFDFFNYGGIHRPVYIEFVDECHVEDITVYTKSYGHLKVEILSECNQRFSLRFKLVDKEGRVILNEESSNEVFEKDVNNVIPWSPDNPYLYTLIVEMYVGGNLKDSVYERIGFRDVEVKDGKIYLNGKPIFLKGFGRHEDFPILGKFTYGAVLVRDFYLMRKIGANSFRTSHYPYSNEHLDLADEMGFLVILEPPLCYSNISRVMSQEEIAKMFGDVKYFEKVRDTIKEMIRQHKNRPSVIMYSVMNEPPSDIREVAEFIRREVELFKSLDSSRPVTFASHRSVRDLALEYVDVISLNYYHGWYTEWGDIDSGVKVVAIELEEIHKKFPEKPIIITEFGADAIYGLHSDPPQMWSEEYQSEMIRKYIEALREKDYIVGFHIWNFADFRTPQNPSRTILNRKGIFTRDRQPKLAAKVVEELFKNKLRS